MLWIRWFKRTAPAALAFIFLLYQTPCLHAQGSASSQNDLNFLFAVGAQLAKPGAAKPVPVETHTVLNSGDRIKFFLESKSDAYFYLFHLGPNSDLGLLYPPDLQKSQAPPGQPFYVPDGPMWFELDATRGTEKFFFLASKSRLSELENLYARHIALKDRADIPSSTQAILDEISRLNKQRRSLAAPAEKPVRIAGKFRAPSSTDSAALPDITPLVKEIVAQGFYSKTFTIDHR
jgi:hypothetical protein